MSKQILVFLCALCALLPLTGCGNEDHVNIFHATFVADGVPKDFKTQVGFTFCPNTYCIGYYLDSNDLYRNALFIYVPTDVRSNSHYTQDSAHCFILYDDTTNTGFDTRFTGSTFDLTVSDWGGAGKYAHGTFFAAIKDSSLTKTVTIASGSFEGFIHQ